MKRPLYGRINKNDRREVSEKVDAKDSLFNAADKASCARNNDGEKKISRAVDGRFTNIPYKPKPTGKVLCVAHEHCRVLEWRQREVVSSKRVGGRQDGYCRHRQ